MSILLNFMQVLKLSGLSRRKFVCKYIQEILLNRKRMLSILTDVMLRICIHMEQTQTQFQLKFCYNTAKQSERKYTISVYHILGSKQWKRKLFKLKDNVGPSTMAINWP